MSSENFSRRKFVHALGGAAGLIAGNVSLVKASSGGTNAGCVQLQTTHAEDIKITTFFDRESDRPGRLEVENPAFRLSVKIADGLSPHFLLDKKNNVVLANDDYYYGFGCPREVKVETSDLPDGGKEISFAGFTDKFAVVHRFVFPKKQDWFEEYLELKNISGELVSFSGRQEGIRSGFSSIISESAPVNALSQNSRFLAVPFLINTNTGERQEYLVKSLITDKPVHIASEGWIIANVDSSILLIKYSQEQMEHAVVNTHLPFAGAADTGTVSRLVWGGSGLHHGNPEAAMNFLPNQTLKFGVNRYISFTGDERKGFALFREFMDAKGHHFPPNFNPPVHWNEIYDNPHWWNAPDTEEKRAQYYRFKDMEIEAAKAAELGCEALYLDPGWDTVMGSTIWADKRLMSCREFCNIMNKKYNLKVSLHTPLAVWNNESAYPESAQKPFPVNNNHLCSGAPAWWQTKLERLSKLAADGICFFMFDGTNYTGACQVRDHYHVVPYTREAHIRSYARLAKEIHKKFPDVLIEMHDQILGPDTGRYVPLYYTHDKTSFDEIWAFEYMWDPMEDLISGRFRSLYYYNLAYNIPLYDHINLKTDNTNALVFWWTASTCRHLGIGGKNGVKSSPPNVEVEYAHLGIGENNGPPPEIWEAHKKAMKTYMRLKAFYARGFFTESMS